MVRDLFRAPWLLDPRTFGGDDSGSGGGGDSGGGGGSSDSGSSSSSSSSTEKQTIGQVSSTGQYAGDGFEWVENEGGYLTRTYTGEGKDNGLGTDVRFGGTEDKPVKEAIAAISLNQTNKPETVFGETKASATDGSLLDLFRDEEDQVGSSSYAEQIGAKTTTPSQTFDEAFASNRAAGKKTFTWNGNEYTTDLAPEPAPEPEPEPTPTPLTDAEKEAALFEQPVIQGESDLPDTVSEDFFDQFETPTIDYTVSQGEAGRGGPDSAAPTFTYEPGVDPVKEALVNLKNTAPETLSTSERLIANEYERERAEAAVDPGIQVAEVEPATTTDVSPDLSFTNPRIGYESGQDVLQSSPDFLTGADGSGPNTTGGVSDAFYGGTAADISPAYALQEAEELAALAEPKEATLGEKTLDALKNFGIGVLSQPAEMFGGIADYQQAKPYTGTGNLTLDLLSEITSRMNPEASREAILTQDVDKAAARGAGARAASDVLQSGADFLEDYLFPEGRSQAVVTGTTPSELALTDVSGEGGVGGLTNVVAEETAGGVIDRALALNPFTRVGSAVLNAGEQLSGTEATASQAVDQLVSAGALDDNEIFQKALEAQGGDVEKAKQAVVNAALFSASGPTAATGAVDAILPGGGFLKDMALRSATEGGQEVAESILALNALNKTLGLEGDGKLQITQDAAGNFVMGALTGGATTGVTNPLINLGTGATDAITKKMDSDAGATGGITSIVPGGPQPGGPGTNVATAAQTAPQVQTGINTMLSPTFGEIAQSNVPTSYSVTQDSPVGLLEGPALSQPTSMDVMAAKEIIDNIKAEQGTVPVEVMANLQQATGLSMQELSDLATDSVINMGNVSFDPAVGTEAPVAPDLMDEPTGIGGGSNISVEPLPSGDTLLRNNDTGRTTVVNAGQDLAEAIQVFDEVSTPFTSPEVDTTPLALPSPDISEASALPPFMMGEPDVAPTLPGGISQIQLPSGPIQLPSVEVQSGVPNIDAGLPTIADAGSTDVGGLEGEILGGEVGQAEDIVDDEGLIIEGELVQEPEQLTEVEVVDRPTTIPPVGGTVVDTGTDSEPEPEPGRPLTEVGEFPEPPADDDEPPADDDGGPGVTVEVDGEPPEFVAPEVSIDDDGNTETKCPEGYQMVEGPDGPTCQKSVETVRMRAGRGLQPYSNLVIPEGYKGPGQRRVTRRSVRTAPVQTS